MVVSPEVASLLVSGASVVFAGALTFVTYLYYRETQDQTDEMEKTRKAKFRPILKPTLFVEVAGATYFAFENTGKGAAHNVSASWEYTTANEEVDWRSPLVSPDERHEFFLPADNIAFLNNPDDIREKVGEDGKLLFQAEYEDPLGRPYSTREELDIVAILDGRMDKGELIEKEESEKFRDELAGIRRTLSEIHTTLSE